MKNVHLQFPQRSRITLNTRSIDKSTHSKKYAALQTVKNNIYTRSNDDPFL